MRKINFRLLYDKEIVGYEKWDGGSNCWLYHEHPLNNIKNKSTHSYGIDVIEGWSIHMINHNHKDNFSHVYDIDESGVFENDVVLSWIYGGDPEYGGDEKISLVTFDRGGFIINRGRDDYFLGDFPGRFKIIGNVWENRNILKDSDLVKLFIKSL